MTAEIITALVSILFTWIVFSYYQDYRPWKENRIKKFQLTEKLLHYLERIPIILNVLINCLKDGESISIDTDDKKIGIAEIWKIIDKMYSYPLEKYESILLGPLIQELTLIDFLTSSNISQISIDRIKARKSGINNIIYFYRNILKFQEQISFRNYINATEPFVIVMRLLQNSKTAVKETLNRVQGEDF